jgi:type II secretory pathway pseudopilin PulG
VKLPLPSPKSAPDAARARIGTPHSAFRIPHSPLAFTLIEILVTIALLAFIILGLFAVFGQVQRAFRTSMNQVDQLEAGRAVSQLLPEELEQVVASTYPITNGVNFYVQMLASAPLTQSLPGTSLLRTNYLEDCFMLLRQNRTWIGIGYCVRTNDLTGRLWLPECGPGQMGVGSLYRYMATTNVIRSDGLLSDPAQLAVAFRNACVPGSPESLSISNRICDGIIDFHFRAFATNGFPIISDGSTTNAYYCTNAIHVPPLYGLVRPAVAVGNLAFPDGLAGLYFYSNAVPAVVQMEFGILEQHAWERYKSLGVPKAQLNYLQSTNYYLSSLVHIFRQRISIRNVDPSAYQ